MHLWYQFEAPMLPHSLVIAFKLQYFFADFLIASTIIPVRMQRFNSSKTRSQTANSQIFLIQNTKVVIATHLICVKHLVKHKGFILYGVYNVWNTLYTPYSTVQISRYLFEHEKLPNPSNHQWEQTMASFMIFEYYSCSLATFRQTKPEV